MRRLKIEGRDEGVALQRKPLPIGGPSELVASLASAVNYVGCPATYGDLLADCGTAFAIRVSETAFRHEDALPAQWRTAVDALKLWGFAEARVSTDPSDPVIDARLEVAADRPVAVAGCFPEAPWRGGLIVEVGDDRLWTVMDVDGRLHRMAPRASVLITIGPNRLLHPPAPLDRLRLWLHSIEAEQDCDGPRAWANWLCLLHSLPLLAEPVDVRAHEYLYETLLDARIHAAAVILEVADQYEGVAADWLRLAAARYERLAAHLESRRPPLHSAEIYDHFADPAVSRMLIAHIETAAELDLDARSALTNAPRAEYPPEQFT